jgi:multidrug efflux pump subunit AcrA (membrane-fusion protein)
LDQQDQEIAQSKITRRPLVSPIEGEVTFANFTQGQTIHEGQLLYRVTNRKEVGFLVRVPEVEYRPWPANTVAKVRFDSLPGKVFAGRLEKALPVVDPLSRAREILLRLENPDELLRLGMIGQVEVELP